MEILTKKSTIQQVNGDVPEGGQLCIAIKKQALMGLSPQQSLGPGVEC
jgi:hypothetical protein